MTYSTIPQKISNIQDKLKRVGCAEEVDIYFSEGKFSLIIGSLSALNIIIILALKLEYNIIFPKKDNDWMHYNFNNDKKSILEDSFCSDISIGEKETRWNRTGTIISLIRLLITYALCYGILLIFHFFPYETKQVWVYIMINSLLPFSFIFFFMFNFSKVIFRHLNLSNECVIILSG